MFLKELISQGWQALMRDRMRSALTMLGIVWGLASVVLLLAYGQGLGGCVLNAFLNMGNNVIVVGAAHKPGGVPTSKTNVKGYVRGFDVVSGKRLWTLAVYS